MKHIKLFERFIVQRYDEVGGRGIDEIVNSIETIFLDVSESSYDLHMSTHYSRLNGTFNILIDFYNDDGSKDVYMSDLYDSLVFVIDYLKNELGDNFDFIYEYVVGYDVDEDDAMYESYNIKDKMFDKEIVTNNLLIRIEGIEV